MRGALETLEYSAQAGWLYYIPPCKANEQLCGRGGRKTVRARSGIYSKNKTRQDKTNEHRPFIDGHVAALLTKVGFSKNQGSHLFTNIVNSTRDIRGLSS